MTETFPAVRVTVRSAIPGRVRWDVPSSLERPDVASFVEASLVVRPGVVQVSANPVTGRVLLSYDTNLSLNGFQEFLESILDSAFERRHAPAAHALKPNGASIPRILELTSGHRRSAAVALAVAVVDRLFEAAPSAMIGAAVDIVTRKGASPLCKLGLNTVRSQLFALAGISAVVWALDSTMSYFHSITTGNLAGEVQDDLRNRAYRQLQTLDLAQLEARPLNDWISLVRSDTGRIAHFIEEGIDPFVLMATNAVTVAATFLINSPALAAVQLLVLPGLYFVSTRMLGPIRERQEVGREHEDHLNAAVLNNVEGMATIASFGRQQDEAQRIARLGEAQTESAQHTAQLSSAYVPAIQMVISGGFLTTLVWGGNLVEQGKLSVAFYNVMGFAVLRLFSSLARLGTSLEQFQRTRVSFDRLIRLLDMRPTIQSGSRAIEPGQVSGEIEFDGVTFRYVPERAALNGICLRIAAGKTTAIVGATGAGKTTLQKLLLRFCDPESGSIRLDGVDIRELRVADLRSLMAAVPQQTFLFDGTVRENIAYARPDAPIKEVEQAARAAQADAFIQCLPGGYDAPVGENGGKLSGGQRQRLAIARAVLAARPILLFDEATSAIDYETERAMQESLRSVTEARTVVIVAHRLSTVRHADCIYVLEEGQVREQGRHEELLAADGLYANLWRIQTGETQREAAPVELGIESLAPGSEARKEPVPAVASADRLADRRIDSPQLSGEEVGVSGRARSKRSTARSKPSSD